MSTLSDTLDRSCVPLSSGRKVAYAAAMNSPPEDSALMLRYQDGDVAAFEILYRRHNDPLYRYLLRLCGQRDTAEDLYQDVWSKIIKTRDRYRPTAKFTTFLYRVAHNAFIDHIRRNKRYSGGDATFEPATEPCDEPDTLADKSLARERLLTALADLPDEQRDAYLLHAESGLSLDEIGQVTGASRETVKSRLRYATGKLKNALATHKPDARKDIAQ